MVWHKTNFRRVVFPLTIQNKVDKMMIANI